MYRPTPFIGPSTYLDLRVRTALVLLLGLALAACGGAANDSGGHLGRSGGNGGSTFKISAVSPTHGLPGIDLQISGAGLGQGAVKQVRINDQPATVKTHAPDGSALTVEVPSQPGGADNPATITVVNSADENATLAAAFTYDRPPYTPIEKRFDGTNTDGHAGTHVEALGLIPFNGRNHRSLVIADRFKVRVVSAETEELIWQRDVTSMPCRFHQYAMYQGSSGWVLTPSIGVMGKADIDGDGVKDLLVGDVVYPFRPPASYYASPATYTYTPPANTPVNQGRVCAYSGVDGSLMFQLSLAGAVDADYFGYTVAGIGDLNRDGKEDFAVTARHVAAGRPGWSVYLYDADAVKRHYDQHTPGIYWLAPPRERIEGDCPRKLSSGQHCDRLADLFGMEIAAVGDMDGDGFDEYAISAPYHTVRDNNYDYMHGAVYLYSGIATAPFKVLVGGQFHQFGSGIAGDCDINGDGKPDLLVSDVLSNPLGVFAYRYDPTTINKVVPIFNQPFAPSYPPTTYGDVVSCAGDLDLDGHDDVLASSTQGIHAFAHSGADQSVIFSKAYATHNNFYGTSLVAVGDTNGDGSPEVAIGAPSHFTGSRSGFNADGAVYLLNTRVQE